MKYLLLPILLITRAIIADPISEQLEALQQLRTLIPERVWYQEFSILVDQKGFEEQANLLMDHKKRESTIQSSVSIAESKDYFLSSTMSGENVRILDSYQQFEQSPFWHYPEMMDKLEWLEEENQ
jgi:hypothetical protein